MWHNISALRSQMLLTGCGRSVLCSSKAQKYAMPIAAMPTTSPYTVSNRVCGTAHSSPETPKELTLFQRFKQDFARYWYVMFPIHAVTSFGYFLGFYYLSKMGISPIPLMEVIGVPKEYVDPLKDSNVSHAAIGYAGYKLITPIRYMTSITVTGYTVRTLSKRGWLKPLPTFKEFTQKFRRS